MFKMTNNSNRNQTDIFSMFDIPDEFAEKQKREAEERKRQLEEMKKNVESSPTIKGKSQTSKPKVEPFNVDLGTVIRYLGEDLPLTEYFTPEEILEGLPQKDSDEKRKINGEDVRKKIEKDFPELVAAYTEMVSISKKNILIPISKMKKKGFMELEKEAKKASFSQMKKVPFNLLSDFTEIARHFAQQGVEVHADVYLNLDTDTLFLDIPSQEACKYWVESKPEAAIITAEKLCDVSFQKVMEIHSHHMWRATPSIQDDKSEKGPFLYAIIGEVDDMFPDITVRRYNSNTEEYVPLNPIDIFESPFKPMESGKYDLSVVEVIE